MTRFCRNPRCHDPVYRLSALLCPSCQLVGRAMFGAGALLAGLLVGWLR